MEIYAEIDRNTLKQMEDGHPLLLPSGVLLYRENHSRACRFECEDKSAKEDLIDFLDEHRMAWQDISDEPEDKETKKERKEKSLKRKSGHIGFSDFNEMRDSWNNKK